MPFNAMGQWIGRRPDQPPADEWRHLGVNRIAGTALHHMIDWAVLNDFWNQLVLQRHNAAGLLMPNQVLVNQLEAEIVRYLQITDFDGNAQQILGELQGGQMDSFRDRDLAAHDNLAHAICWQPYNLFEGPPPGQHAGNWYRPPHSPDFGQLRRELPYLAPPFFDFPIVCPIHIQRASLLHGVYLHMSAFNGGAAPRLAACLRLLNEVSHLNVIPAYDINWYALLRADFLALTPHQRMQFFQACFQFGWQPTQERIANAYLHALGA